MPFGVSFSKVTGITQPGRKRDSNPGSSAPEACALTTRPTRRSGLVVKATASRATDPGVDSRFRRGSVPRSSHTSDLKVCTPVAALPSAWRGRASAGTGRPGVSLL